MTALAAHPDPRDKRSDQSKRLYNLKNEAAQIRQDLENQRITPEEAIERLNKLTKRHSTFFNRILDL